MPLTIASVAAALKNETAAAHSHAENILLPRLSGIRSRRHYAAVLKTFYGYFFPVQQLIAQQISSSDLHDIDERRHASLLLCDLESLNVATTVEVCKELPVIENKAQAFGALYVLEGSTLGGRMISNMLMKNSFIQFAEANLQFFSGYKEDTGNKWKSFLDVLNRQTETDVMIAAANETFFLFQHWIKRSLYHEPTN